MGGKKQPTFIEFSAIEHSQLVFRSKNSQFIQFWLVFKPKTYLLIVNQLIVN